MVTMANFVTGPFLDLFGATVYDHLKVSNFRRISQYTPNFLQPPHAIQRLNNFYDITYYRLT